MNFTLELEREDDGRWIAEVPALPGVMAYGATRDEASRRTLALALRCVADRIEHGELLPETIAFPFQLSAHAALAIG